MVKLRFLVKKRVIIRVIYVTYKISDRQKTDKI